jgi:hypothetical protein
VELKNLFQSIIKIPETKLERKIHVKVVVPNIVETIKKRAMNIKEKIGINK